MPSKNTPQRWELEVCPECDWRTTYGNHSHFCVSRESIEIEVMPVSEHEQMRAAVAALHAYLWTGTPDSEDLLNMMLITKRALEREEEQP